MLKNLINPDRWQESCDSLPADIPFLDDHGRILANAESCKVAADVAAKLPEMAAFFAASADYRLLAWHMYRCLYVYEESCEWVRLEDVFGEKAGYLYVLIALEQYPLTRQKHKELNITPGEVADTGYSTGACVDNFRANHNGKAGMFPAQFNWQKHYVHGRLFQVGRFQYMLKNNPLPVKVYRKKSNHDKITVFADHNTPFDAAGYNYGEENAAWHSVLEYSGDTVCGNIISPRGMALRETAQLDLNEWAPALGEDQYYMDMHIPAGGGMTLDVSFKSFADAFAFFARHFAEKNPVAVVCHSWIFNTQYMDALPESNLAKLMREVFLYPYPSKGQDGVFFLFGTHKIEDPKSMPRDTSVRRACLDVLDRGGKLRTGGMFLMKEYFLKKYNNLQ